MKTKVPLLVPLLGCCALLPLAQADQHASKTHFRVLAAANEPEGKVEKRIVVRHGDQLAEMQKVAFLGVETSPVAAELSAQLNLAPNVGLVVRHIVPDSPAAAALQKHDILLKIDDQMLIHPRQFSVLVRNHKAGDEISLTYVRGGKETTAKVKLVEHEVPKFALFDADGAGGDMKYFVHSGGLPMPSEDLNRTLSLLDRAHAGAASGTHHVAIAGPGFHSTTVNTSNSNMVFNDEQGALELTIKEGKKTLVAKNPKGETLFSGPIDTPEQRRALPAEVRSRLEKIEGMEEFTFRTDDEPDADVLKAAPRGISLPVPPSTGREAGESQAF